MRNSIKQKGNQGFTLVEILVVSAIFIIMLGIMHGIYMAGLDVWEIGRYQADLQAQARRALNYMVLELSSSPELSIPDDKQVHFYLPEDRDGDGLITDADGQIEWDINNQIHYQFIPGQKILRRLEKGEEMIFVRDVSDVQFLDINTDDTLAINELKIILTLTKTTPRQRNVSVTLSSIVALRNL